MATARDRLLEAALTEFARRGYDGAVTRDILDAASVTAPSLYHHFGSKAGLFTAVAEQVMDRVVGAMEDALAGNATAADRLDAILVASVRLQARHPELPRFVVVAPLDLARHPELAEAAPQMNRLGEFFHEQLGDSVGDVALTLIYGLSRFAAHQKPGAFANTVEAVRRLVRGDLVGETEA